MINYFSQLPRPVCARHSRGHPFFHKEGDVRSPKHCDKNIDFQFMVDNVFYMKLPINKSLNGLSTALRHNSTKAECVLWRYLKNKNAFGYQFHRQKVVGKYIADFYCPGLSLVIEVDGNSHDDKYEYDCKRDEYLKSLGLNILRLDNSDILFNVDKALYAIETYMQYLMRKNNKPDKSE